jgi:pyridoxal phosphate-dependent aminotransferase EpsN
MSPQALERAFQDASHENKLPKAVIVVNLYGQSAKMDEIMSICSRYNVPIIEDAAESFGGTYKGKASGTLGLFGIYSFNGNKIITTSGGGMIISNDQEAMNKARFLATQARDPAPYYQHSHIGFNYRMSNILAGIGRGQLEVLPKRVEERRRIFEQYYKELAHLPGIYFMPELKDTQSNRWLTALTINEKEAGVTAGEVLVALTKENIEARPVWKPLHLQPIFDGLRYYPHRKNDSVSDRLFQQGLCLPSGSNMAFDDQMRVIECIKESINSGMCKRVLRAQKISG